MRNASHAMNAIALPGFGRILPRDIATMVKDESKSGVNAAGQNRRFPFTNGERQFAHGSSSPTFQKEDVAARDTFRARTTSTAHPLVRASPSQPSVRIAGAQPSILSTTRKRALPLSMRS